MKERIWKLLPGFIRRAWSGKTDTERYGWHGDYPSWQDAVNDSGGYDVAAIFEKVQAAALKVKRGEALFERDGIVFHKYQFPEASLQALQNAADAKNGILHVLDFGGGPGSSYFLYRKLLKNVKELRWHVVEQSHFVKAGNEKLADESLRFFNSPEEAMNGMQAQVLILSSVLHYLESPEKMIGSLLVFDFQTIIIETTPCIQDIRPRITVQRVPPFIYEASYPCHIFTEKELLSWFPGYRVKERYISKAVESRKIGGMLTEWLGFVLVKG